MAYFNNTATQSAKKKRTPYFEAPETYQPQATVGTRSLDFGGQQGVMRNGYFTILS